MPFERDEEILRIIGYNEAIEFYDPDRTLQQKIFLQDNNLLNIAGAVIAPGATETIGGGLQPHALSDLTIHTGLLSNDQAPQFLLMDGTRDLIGDLNIDDGAGDSPVLNFIGGTNDDTISVWLADGAGAGESDLQIKLCDTGTDYSRVKIVDSGDTIVLAFGDQGNIFMSDDAYIGIESGGRVAFNSTTTPDEVQVLDADLYLAATGYGIKHVDGVTAGQFLRANGTRYVPDTLDVADLTDLAYATPSLTLGTSNAAGAANSVIRSDATILVFDATVPTSLSPDDSAATGSAGTAARRDHAHGITCATAGSITPDASAAEGSASSFARSDHTHSITCAAPITDLSGATTNAEGTASTFARSDHSHAIATSGLDTAIVSGTKGTSGNVAMWDANGDLVDGSLAVSDIVDGSGAANRVAYWSDTDTITSDAGLTVDATNNLFLVANSGGIGNSNTTARLEFDSSGATDYAWFSGCRFGVGTSTPGVLGHFYSATTGELEIEGYADNAYLYLNSGTDAGGGEISRIFFQSNSSTKWHLGKNASDTLVVYDSTRGGGVLNVVADGDMALMPVGGSVAVGHSTPDRLLHPEVADSGTTNQVYPLRLGHTTDGTAAVLFGAGVEFELEDAGGNMQVAADIATVWAVATSGSESPLIRMQAYPQGSVGPGRWGFWTWNDVDANSRTIIPNGTGDVTELVWVRYVVVESSGPNAATQITYLETPAAGSVTSDIYNSGGQTCTLSLDSTGQLTVARTAGTSTFDVALMLVWI